MAIPCRAPNREKMPSSVVKTVSVPTVFSSKASGPLNVVKTVSVPTVFSSIASGPLNVASRGGRLGSSLWRSTDTRNCNFRHRRIRVSIGTQRTFTVICFVVYRTEIDCVCLFLPWLLFLAGSPSWDTTYQARVPNTAWVVRLVR